MLRRFLLRLSYLISSFLQHPSKVFLFTFLLVGAGLILDGSLFRLWSLKRDSIEISRRMTVLRNETEELNKKIMRARDPNFIEMHAREKFNLASEGDLIFVFTDSE